MFEQFDLKIIGLSTSEREYLLNNNIMSNYHLDDMFTLVDDFNNCDKTKNIVLIILKRFSAYQLEELEKIYENSAKILRASVSTEANNSLSNHKIVYEIASSLEYWKTIYIQNYAYRR